MKDIKYFKNWMKSKDGKDTDYMEQGKIKELKTFSFGNVTINVLKPDISEKEYQIRHKELERATENMLKSSKN